METFLIYRNGSNAANQSMCSRMAVAIITAENAEQARQIAEQEVTFYANQSSEAVPESEADADDWNFVSQMAAVDDSFVVL